MIISMIVAIGNNREIGLNNKMLWHVREDFKNFKRITMGHHLVMGRKTFESIGKPLPGRDTIIVTRNKSYKQKDCLVAHSLQDAVLMAKNAGEEELFILGGAQIYEQALELASKIHLSRIDFEGEADAYFPQFEHLEWKKTQSVEHEAINDTPSWRYEVLEKVGI
ncbi:MAG: dihydrofolate reductase [Bacteriovoracaceae bacterium]|nr:dihydrofolate reductase [Bacteriovoracaceae bacterium]